MELILKEDASTLSVMESLSGEADIHQRKIASQTGLNLAKVNFVLKKLVAKGFVKLQRVRDNPFKRRYLYLLTPDGLAEKSRLTYRFLQRTMKQYQDAESKVADSIESMHARGVRSVVLWGNTGITDLCLRVFEQMDGGLQVLGVVDQTGSHPMAIHPSRLAGLDPDAIFVCDADAEELPADLPAWRLA